MDLSHEMFAKHDCFYHCNEWVAARCLESGN